MTRRTPSPGLPTQPAPSWGKWSSLQPHSPPGPAFPAVTDADIQKLPRACVQPCQTTVLHTHTHNCPYALTCAHPDTCCDDTLHCACLSVLTRCTHMLQTCLQLHVPSRTRVHPCMCAAPSPGGCWCVHLHTLHGSTAPPPCCLPRAHAPRCPSPYLQLPQQL